MDDLTDGDVVVLETPCGKRPGTTLRPPPEKKLRSLLTNGLQKYEKGDLKPAEVYADLTRVHRKFQDNGYEVFWSGEASGQPCFIKCVDCGTLLSPNNWPAGVRQQE